MRLYMYITLRLMKGGVRLDLDEGWCETLHVHHIEIDEGWCETLQVVTKGSGDEGKWLGRLGR